MILTEEDEPDHNDPVSVSDLGTREVQVDVTGDGGQWTMSGSPQEAGRRKFQVSLTVDSSHGLFNITEKRHRP